MKNHVMSLSSPGILAKARRLQLADASFRDIKLAKSRSHSFSAMIRPMRYLTGCGISPLHHRFTPKVMSKGVSEML